MVTVGDKLQETVQGMEKPFDRYIGMKTVHNFCKMLEPVIDEIDDKELAQAFTEFENKVAALHKSAWEAELEQKERDG